MDMIRKQFRASESEEINNSVFNSAMLDAGIPLPMRRFISDLSGYEDGSMFRPERAFTSFEDLLSDLKQMTINPDRFLHGTHSDRWKIVFDDKLYGREADTEALMVVADRVTRIIDKGALDDRHYRLAGKKSEIVMVSGHSGAGKSRLVRMGGASLEKRGWLFLQCKFDRVGELTTLSIVKCQPL
jgi:ATP-dependent RNA helicase DDX31/DBP7